MERMEGEAERQGRSMYMRKRERERERERRPGHNRRLKECLMSQTSRVGAIISMGTACRSSHENEPHGEIVIQRGGTRGDAKFEFKAGRMADDQQARPPSPPPN